MTIPAECVTVEEGIAQNEIYSILYTLQKIVKIFKI